MAAAQDVRSPALRPGRIRAPSRISANPAILGRNGYERASEGNGRLHTAPKAQIPSSLSNVLNALPAVAEEPADRQVRVHCRHRKAGIEHPSSNHGSVARTYPKTFEDKEMKTAMQMNPMMTGMMPMMGTMPMNQMMMGGMPMMNGMMPMGMMMPMMMCKMDCKMTADGMVCEMMPMDGMSKDMFMECCKRMTMMMGNGMPMMMMCGGMAMMGMTAA